MKLIDTGVAQLVEAIVLGAIKWGFESLHLYQKWMDGNDGGVAMGCKPIPYVVNIVSSNLTPSTINAGMAKLVVRRRLKTSRP